MSPWLNNLYLTAVLVSETLTILMTTSLKPTPPQRHHATADTEGSRSAGSLSASDRLQSARGTPQELQHTTAGQQNDQVRTEKGDWLVLIVG